MRTMRLGLAALTMAALSAGTAPAADYTATVTRIGALTGPQAPGPMRKADVCGTDLGIVAEIGGRLAFAFGDTFGWDGKRCAPFGPNWRSNWLAYSSDTDPSDGVVIDDWYKKPGSDAAVAVAEGVHSAPFKGEQSRIPTALLAVRDRLYLHTMSVHGFASMGGVWLCNDSRFYASADAGKSWTAAPEVFGDFKSSFNMLALSAAAGAGNRDGRYVYALGTPCGRFAGARAARVPAGKVLDNSAWEYFDGSGWVADRAQAAEVIKPGVGEGSLTWNGGLKRWMYTTLNELSEKLELRLALRPEGPWSGPITLVDLAKGYPQAYGAFMTPRWISPDGLSFYFVMSQFGPYNTYIMRAVLTAFQPATSAARWPSIRRTTAPIARRARP